MSEFYGASIPLSDRPNNSKGNSFSTVQGAVDDLAGAGWVYVPSGTWSEAVTISDDDVILFGAGWSSIIDGATTGHAVYISGDRCTVRDLQVLTLGGGGNNFNGVEIDGSHCRVIRVHCSDSDAQAILFDGTNNTALGCFLNDGDGHELLASGLQSNFIACFSDGNMYADAGGDDSIIMGCYINANLDIHADAENCVIDGNRVNGTLTDGSGTSTVGDNDTT